MKIFIDLHLHSRYARGCSKNLNIENLVTNAKLKGLNLLGTGDFTHPLWLKELQEELIEVSDGVFAWSKDPSIYFMLTGEVSTIFLRNGEVKRIHILLGMPSFADVFKLNQVFERFSSLQSDGRPIFKIDLKDLLDIVFEINEEAIFIPAHIWTPWFSLYGSRSGFNSIYEAFGEKTKLITAIETGLSSDPQMNWRLEELDNISITSFSDAHSHHPHRLGREATLIEVENLSYANIYNAFKNPDQKNKILMTIEFFPEEGKYHFDGHRTCGLRLSPEESKKYNNICPVCYKPLTIGVMHRVNDLANRKENFQDTKRPPFIKCVPLTEIIANYYNTEPTTKKVLTIYKSIIQEFGSEFEIVLEKYQIPKFQEQYPEIANAISRIKENKITLIPGYDGEYGKVILFENSNLKERKSPKQDRLF